MGIEVIVAQIINYKVKVDVVVDLVSIQVVDNHIFILIVVVLLEHIIIFKLQIIIIHYNVNPLKIKLNQTIILSLIIIDFVKTKDTVHSLLIPKDIAKNVFFINGNIINDCDVNSNMYIYFQRKSILLEVFNILNKKIIVDNVNLIYIFDYFIH